MSSKFHQGIEIPQWHIDCWDTDKDGGLIQVNDSFEIYKSLEKKIFCELMALMNDFQVTTRIFTSLDFSYNCE